MKKTLFFTLLVLLCLPLSSQELRYVDASSLTFINKPIPTPCVFHRLDTTLYREFNSTVNRYYRYSTGMAILFRTNSRTITASWTTRDHRILNNMTPISTSGLDLYIKRDGHWIFAGFGCGTPTKPEHKATILKDMDDTEKECMLYLPLMVEMLSLQIGIDKDAQLEAMPNPYKSKVVILGSSITHGAAASRAGMTYPALLERRMGVEFVNLGISGQCKIEPVLARVVANTQADLFIIDGFSNPSAQQITERLQPFLKIVRAAHPTTPLIFLQTIVRETTNFDLQRREFERAKRAAAAAGMREILDSGDPNIYFIDPCYLAGEDHEGTVDGVHPTDLGFVRIVDNLAPQLQKIFKKYKIQ